MHERQTSNEIEAFWKKIQYADENYGINIIKQNGLNTFFLSKALFDLIICFHFGIIGKQLKKQITGQVASLFCLFPRLVWVKFKHL